VLNLRLVHEGAASPHLPSPCSTPSVDQTWGRSPREIPVQPHLTLQQPLCGPDLGAGLPGSSLSHLPSPCSNPLWTRPSSLISLNINKAVGIVIPTHTTAAAAVEDLLLVFFPGAVRYVLTT